MATLTVFNEAGGQVGTYELDLQALAPRINRQLLHDVVVMYQANQRLGTHRSKSRGEVSGSTKKMYRQKGTGNARAGSRRAGQRRGGGHVFARRPRDYSYRLPRKAVQLATRMALASRIRDAEMVVVDRLSFAAPKTKQMAGTLKALGLSGFSTLVATAGLDPHVYRSARNIPGVTVSPVSDLNALCVLSPQKVVVTREALDLIVQRAAGKSAEASAV
ncbi:MAG: 50S ribosomal protein L4 [Pirellulales bacterium]